MPGDDLSDADGDPAVDAVDDGDAAVAEALDGGDGQQQQQHHRRRQ